MAARLMEVKSKLLLPRETLEGENEEYEDPRLELVKQLLLSMAEMKTVEW